MARKKNKLFVQKIVSAYAEELSQKISIQGIFVFGSAARGQMTGVSDVDLLVVSKDFKGMDFMKRLELLSRASVKASRIAALDSIGYTPEEFAILDTLDSPNIKQIKREGYFVA